MLTLEPERLKNQMATTSAEAVISYPIEDA
jgi:hypothetical protein